MPYTQQVIDYLEPLVPRRKVDGCDIGYHGELRGGVVFEERYHRYDARRRDIDCKFVLPYGELLDIFRHA